MPKMDLAPSDKGGCIWAPLGWACDPFGFFYTFCGGFVTLVGFFGVFFFSIKNFLVSNCFTDFLFKIQNSHLKKKLAPMHMRILLGIWNLLAHVVGTRGHLSILARNVGFGRLWPEILVFVRFWPNRLVLVDFGRKPCFWPISDKKNWVWSIFGPTKWVCSLLA